MMKIFLLLLAMIGIFLLTIPPPALGLKCARCWGDEGSEPYPHLKLLRCKDFDQGNSWYVDDCDAKGTKKQEYVCATSKTQYNGCYGKMSCVAAGTCNEKKGLCACDDRDFCNAPKANANEGGSTPTPQLDDKGHVVKPHSAEKHESETGGNASVTGSTWTGVLVIAVVGVVLGWQIN